MADQKAATKADTKEEAPAEETPAAPAPARKRDPLPEGFLTPVGYAKHRGVQKGGTEDTIRPQIVYGYVKNMKGFPFKKHTDGRVILNVKEVDAFLDAKERERAEKKAAKEAAEKAAEEARVQAAKAAEQANA
jgi:hypothetical protein